MTELDALRAELIKVQQARDFINENWVKEKAALDEICSQRDSLCDELAAKDARIARYEDADSQMVAAWKAECETARARIAELEATRLHWTGEVARLTQNSCDDQYRAERAEAELKAMREVLELVDADVRHHLRSDAIDHALLRKNAVAAVRAALAPSPAGRPCTCHPDERPDVCQHKYAFSECWAAAHAAPPPAGREG